jgi:hypothetical protein
MDQNPVFPTFACAAQRVVYSHIRSLVEPASPAQASHLALHHFFRAFYQQIYEQPKVFGLPVSADVYVEDDEPDRTKKLAEASRALDKPRKAMSQGLDYLRGVGCAGQVDGDHLVVAAEAYEALLARTKVKRQWFEGMAAAGWAVAEGDGQVTIKNELFPEMMPALKALAEAASSYKDEKMGQFHFARCDFRALQPGYMPDALDLIQMQDAQTIEYLLDLHAYLTNLKYKTQVALSGVHAWVIKYQGNRKVKSSPLYQIEYLDRFKNPLRVFIKCASAKRLVDIIPNQSQRLQEDFSKRVFNCGSCGWCDTREAFGPVELNLGGQQRKICWYVMSDLPKLDGEVVDLVKEYIDLHESLVSLN